MSHRALTEFDRIHSSDENLFLAGILAAIDVLLTPARSLPDRALREVKNARRRYARRGIDVQLHGDKWKLARQLNASRQLIYFRSQKRKSVQLSEETEARVRALCGLPSIADSWPLLMRLRPQWRQEELLIDADTEQARYLLEHRMAPLIAANFVWSETDACGHVAYRLCPTALEREPPAPPNVAVDSEASEEYQARILSGLHNRRFWPL